MSPARKRTYQIATPTAAPVDRIRRFPAWQASAICVGVLLLLGPLLIVPGIFARHLITEGGMGEALTAATIGLVLAIGSFLVLAPLLNIPLRGVFIRWPGINTLRWALVGVLLASALTVVTLISTSGTLVRSTDSWIHVLGFALTAIMIGLWTGTVEELLMRGYLLSIIGHQWSWPGALLVSSLLFGVMHNAGADTEIGAVLYIAMATCAGLFLGLVTLWTGNVWNAVAIHAVWNTFFSEYLFVFDPPPTEPIPLLSYQIEAGGWLVGTGVSSVTESPVAILLFVFAICALVGLRLQQMDEP